MDKIDISKEIISVEYCHIDPQGDYKQRIREANAWVPKVVAGFPRENLQLCVMIDDVHGKYDLRPEALQKFIDLLEVKPDCIYLESAFMKQGEAMIAALLKNGQDEKSKDEIEIIQSLQDKKVWIRERVKTYKAQTEFMISFDKDRDGVQDLSCPSLAAASYLYRLGKVYDNVQIKSIWGQEIRQADRVLNILSSFYVQVEDKVQAIIQAIDTSMLRRTSWFFY